MAVEKIKTFSFPEAHVFKWNDSSATYEEIPASQFFPDQVYQFPSI